MSATLADAFATDPILQWLAPSQRSDRRLRRLLAIELEYYVFTAGRVLTTGCDREGVPAHLEASTERSAALYKRLGFVHLGELRVPSGPPVLADATATGRGLRHAHARCERNGESVSF